MSPSIKKWLAALGVAALSLFPAARRPIAREDRVRVALLGVIWAGLSLLLLLVDAALGALRSHPLGEGAAVIGRVKDDPPGLVLLKTSFGGTRIVDLLVGDPLPRIC